MIHSRCLQLVMLCMMVVLLQPAASDGDMPGRILPPESLNCLEGGGPSSVGAAGLLAMGVQLGDKNIRERCTRWMREEKERLYQECRAVERARGMHEWVAKVDCDLASFIAMPRYQHCPEHIIKGK